MLPSSPNHFNLKSFIRNIFSPKSPLDFLGLVFITTLINLLAAGNPIGFLGTLAIALIWWQINLKFAQQRQEQLNALTGVEKKPPEAAPGLILLLSPYSSRNPLLKSPEKLNHLLNKICQTFVKDLTEADFLAIDLSNSNLWPQIKAVDYHLSQGKLKEVWLISTPTINEIQGSDTTAKILETYLKFKYGNQLQIHFQGFKGQTLLVEDGDYGKLYQIINYIFQQSDYKDDVIIADITGGTKMMSVALAMACIPPKRKMQYMDSKRDWEGNPLKTGEIKPVVIDVDPILYLD
ncbi:hypothetical protein [Crocosphaera sp. XPORK-15E]|uniref:hypothetical protein n=1 Tax=Crocosphaera sp. XPORK-15E TaxID=3110247 RepID=UPI002B1FF422|nr:hypothetical protein [Crocosphaera sp. XPORK-15E]MEA5537322.1 hypothetical protein [Crocosphaera sp. XPORK-15E]